MRPPDLLDCVLIDVLWADRLSALSNLAHCNGHIPIIEMELTRRSWPGRQWICGKSQWHSAATAAIRDHFQRFHRFFCAQSICRLHFCSLLLLCVTLAIAALAPNGCTKKHSRL